MQTTDNRKQVSDIAWILKHPYLKPNDDLKPYKTLLDSVRRLLAESHLMRHTHNASIMNAVQQDKEYADFFWFPSNCRIR